ncbi:MAG TPA: hypothetical protein VHC63_13690 [Acidimicrobiales bacterium]|nr:hypothetical protein [Acidimicrobiales bacterium]
MTVQDATPDETVVPAAAEPPEPLATETAPKARHNGLKIAVVVLAGVCLVLSVLAANLSAHNRDTEGRSAAVRRVAGAMGTAMLSYDYQHLPQAKERVVKLATGSFKKQYREAFDGGLDQLYKLTKQHSEVRAVDVYVGDVSSSDATAIVRVDFRVSGVGGNNRPGTAFFELALVHSSGGWLVDSLSAINAGNDSSGGSTATTTPAG